MEVEITGVAEALGNLTARGAIDPVVKANISLSESGFVSIQDPIAFGEIKDDSFVGKSLSFIHFLCATCSNTLVRQIERSLCH
jgi:hypothetical protein